MKRLGLFLKTTTLGGLFVLLPVIFAGFLISKAIGAVRIAAAKILGLLTAQPSESVSFPMVWAALLVLALSFVLGLLMTSRLASRSGRRIEQAVLFRLPGYAALKNIINGLAQTEREGMVRPALVTASESVQYFAFVMEEHGDGRLTIFVPSAPSAANGGVQVVRREKVKILNVRLASVIAALNQWGAGTHKLLTKDLENAASLAALRRRSPVAPSADE